MAFNKYTLATSVFVLASVLTVSLVGAIAYKMGMEKGRIDQATYWALQGSNGTTAKIIEAVRYYVPEDAIDDTYQRLTSIKEIPLYLYEVNGVRTVVAVCTEACDLALPPGHRSAHQEPE